MFKSSNIGKFETEAATDHTLETKETILLHYLTNKRHQLEHASTTVSWVT